MKVKSYLLLSMLLGLFSCNNKPSFKVEGEIANADKKMLYLDELKIDGTSVVDSVKLDKKGLFLFTALSPKSPEFYRLRLDDKVINFSIDSTENLNISSDAKSFSEKYKITGSENAEKIRELVMLQINLQKDINNISKNENIPAGVAQDSLRSILKIFKDKVRRNYIFKAPNKTYAYFALFQQFNNYMIFDPYTNKEDIKCFAAVATSLNNNYPEAERSKNLYNIVIKGMKNTYKPIETQVAIPEGKIKQSGVIDIELRDKDGNNHKLTDFAGSVVLLDFTVYNDKTSIEHNLALRDIYSKYKDQGMEIFQVSLDSDEHFWKTVSDNLPWICVNDKDGTASKYVNLYNLRSLPSFFVINRKNELVKRSNDLKIIEKEIKKVL